MEDNSATHDLLEFLNSGSPAASPPVVVQPTPATTPQAASDCVDFALAIPRKVSSYFFTNKALVKIKAGTYLPLYVEVVFRRRSYNRQDYLAFITTSPFPPEPSAMNDSIHNIGPPMAQIGWRPDIMVIKLPSSLCHRKGESQLSLAYLLHSSS